MDGFQKMLCHKIFFFLYDNEEDGIHLSIPNYCVLFKNSL